MGAQKTTLKSDGGQTALMSTHYCQACHTRAVVVGSADPEHCAGKYPFHCCCVCAIAAGWTGWQVEHVLWAWGCCECLIDCVCASLSVWACADAKHKNQIAPVRVRARGARAGKRVCAMQKALTAPQPGQHRH